MHIIPVSVIDNFLSNPNSIRNWALRQEFFPDPNGQWPGQRTKLLSEINPELANLISCKYFNLFLLIIIRNIEKKLKITNTP